MPLKTLAALAALLAAAPLAAQTSVQPGQTVNGRLEEGDRQMDGDGEYYDPYVIRVRPGELVEVRVESEDFDTFLHWVEETGEEYADKGINDDYGEGTGSRLLMRADSLGEIRLRASSYGEGEEGAYTLRVAARPAPQPVRLRLGQLVEGEITESDFEGLRGREDYYVISGSGLVVTVLAESDSIDTYLEFGEWRDGWVDVRLQDDDGGPGMGSRLVVELDGGAEYGIVVRALNGGNGPYRLIVADGEIAIEEPGAVSPWYGDDWPAADSVADYSRMPADAPRITALETVQGTLDQDNRRDRNGRYYEEFLYEARAGEQLRIRLFADAFDAYLQLGSGTENDFSLLAEDDDSGADLDAELAWTAPRAGAYTIRVTSALESQTGAYVLRILSDR